MKNGISSLRNDINATDASYAIVTLLANLKRYGLLRKAIWL